MAKGAFTNAQDRYKCLACKDKFNDDKWIKDHNKIRHKDHDYVCGKCHNAFETKVELEEHKLNDKHGVNN